jgi:hypothetical protein
MIDIVYPLNKASRWQDNELRYSLRSVEKYLSNYGRVFVVGDLPGWCTNVIHIPATDRKYPARSIMEKVWLACQDDRLSENFLFMNDDHFLTKRFDAETFPYFFKGPLFNAVRNKTNYAETVKNTLSILGHDAKDFDTHTPILYNKHTFPEVMKQYDWEVPHGYCIKSIYCAYMGIAGVLADDGKFYKSKTKEHLLHWFSNHAVVSVGDECLTYFVKELLGTLFQTKSKYEL